MTALLSPTRVPSTSIAIGVLAGVGSYGLLREAGVIVSVETSTTEAAVAYGVFIFLGTILTVGVPIGAFSASRLVGPLIALGFIGCFWSLVGLYTSDPTVVTVAPAFWFIYLLLYFRLYLVCDVIAEELGLLRLEEGE